jgi:hypothetical protein
MQQSQASQKGLPGRYLPSLTEQSPVSVDELPVDAGSQDCPKIAPYWVPGDASPKGKGVRHGQ